jgi:hypothetical protein
MLAENYGSAQLLRVVESVLLPSLHMQKMEQNKAV